MHLYPHFLALLNIIALFAKLCWFLTCLSACLIESSFCCHIDIISFPLYIVSQTAEEMIKIRIELSHKVSELEQLQMELHERENKESNEGGLRRVIETLQNENYNLKVIIVAFTYFASTYINLFLFTY